MYLRLILPNLDRVAHPEPFMFATGKLEVDRFTIHRLGEPLVVKGEPVSVRIEIPPISVVYEQNRAFVLIDDKLAGWCGKRAVVDCVQHVLRLGVSSPGERISILRGYD